MVEQLRARLAMVSDAELVEFHNQATALGSADLVTAIEREIERRRDA